MVSCRFVVFMKFFQILDEVVYSLSVEKLCMVSDLSTMEGSDGLTLRMTWEGSVLLIAWIYWDMALS